MFVGTNHTIINEWLEKEVKKNEKEKIKLEFKKDYTSKFITGKSNKTSKTKKKKESSEKESIFTNPTVKSKKNGKKEKINLSNKLTKKERRKLKKKSAEAIEAAEIKSWENFKKSSHDGVTSSIGIARANIGILEEAERLAKIDKHKKSGYNQLWIATKDENGAIKIIRNPNVKLRSLKGTSDSAIIALNNSMIADLTNRVKQLESSGEYSDLALANLALWQNQEVAYGRKYIGKNKKGKPLYELEPSKVLYYNKKKGRPFTELDKQEEKRLEKKQKKAKKRFKDDKLLRKEISDDLGKTLSTEIEISHSLDKLDSEPFVRIIKAATSDILEIRGKDHRGIERNITHHGNTKLLIEDFFKNQGYEVLERTEDEDAKEGTNISVAFVKDDDRHIIKIPIASNGATDLRMDKYFLDHPQLKQYMPRIVAEDYAANFSVHEKIYPIARYSEIILLELFRSEINDIFEHISKYLYLIDVSPDHTFNNMGLMRIDRNEYMDKNDFNSLDLYLNEMKERLYVELEKNKSISVLVEAKRDDEWKDASIIGRVKHAIYKIYRAGKDKDIERFGILINEIIKEDRMQELKSEIESKYTFGFVDLSMCIPIDKNNKFVHYDESGFGLKCDQVVRSLSKNGNLKGKYEPCPGSFRYVKKPFKTLNMLTDDCEYGVKDKVEYDSSMMCTWHTELVCDCCGVTKDISNSVVNDPRNYYRLLDNSLGLKDYETMEEILGEGCIKMNDGAKTSISIHSDMLKNMNEPETRQKLQRIREIFDTSIEANHRLAEEVTERMKMNGFEGVIYLSPDTMNNVVYLVPELGNKDGKMKLINVRLYFNEGEGKTKSILAPKGSNVFKIFKYIFKHIMNEKPSNIYKLSPSSYSYYKASMIPSKKSKFSGSEHLRIQTLIYELESSKSDFLCDYTSLEDDFEDLYKAYRIPALLKFNDLNYQYMGDMESSLGAKDDSAYCVDSDADTDSITTPSDLDPTQATWVIRYMDEDGELVSNINVVRLEGEVEPGDDLDDYSAGIDLASSMRFKYSNESLNPRCDYCEQPINSCKCNKLYVVETALIEMTVEELEEELKERITTGFVGVIDNMSDYSYELSLRKFNDPKIIDSLIRKTYVEEVEEIVEEQPTIKLSFSSKGKDLIERHAEVDTVEVVETVEEIEEDVCLDCGHNPCTCVCLVCLELLEECTCDTELNIDDEDDDEDEELEDGDDDICEECGQSSDECVCEDDEDNSESDTEDFEDSKETACKDCGMEFEDCVCEDLGMFTEDDGEDLHPITKDLITIILDKNIDSNPDTLQVIELLTNLKALQISNGGGLVITEDLSIANEILNRITESGIRNTCNEAKFIECLNEAIEVAYAMFGSYQAYAEEEEMLEDIYVDLKNGDIHISEEDYTSSDLMYVGMTTLFKAVKVLREEIDPDLVIDTSNNNFEERNKLDKVLIKTITNLMDDLIHGDNRDTKRLSEITGDDIYRIMGRLLLKKIISNSLHLEIRSLFKHEGVISTFKNEEAPIDNIVIPYYSLFKMIVSDETVRPSIGEVKEIYSNLLVDEYIVDNVFEDGGIFTLGELNEVYDSFCNLRDSDLAEGYEEGEVFLYQKILDYILSFVDNDEAEWFQDTIIKYDSYKTEELRVQYAQDTQSISVGFIDVDVMKGVIELKHKHIEN
jgi:hypothetical protein